MRFRQLWWVWAMAGTSVLAQPISNGGVGNDFQATLWGASCMACHGTDGRAEGTGLTIGGRDADELYGLMLAYKAGSRSATIMHQHVRGYSDAELKRIAVYFSQLK